MIFKYKDDPVQYEYEVRYLDKDDEEFYTYINAYSERQASYKVRELYLNCSRVISVEEIREIPNKHGKQLEMDFRNDTNK